MLLDRVKAVMTELNDILVERKEVIDLAMLALLSKEHLLLLGPPGVAKSMLIRELSSHIVDSIYFEKLLTKFSTPEELFGPLSLSALENDQYKRVTKGTLVEAEFGFVDEIN